MQRCFDCREELTTVAVYDSQQRPWCWGCVSIVLGAVFKIPEDHPERMIRGHLQLGRGGCISSSGPLPED